MVWTEQALAMIGVAPDETWAQEITIQELADGLAQRNWVFRVRILQQIILIGMLVRPTPPELDAKLRAAARALNVGDEITADGKVVGAVTSVTSSRSSVTMSHESRREIASYVRLPYQNYFP